jgi:hypothetical protein
MSERINVTFTHPREGGRSFSAKISPQCTGQMSIEGLMLGNEDGPFLDVTPPGRPYELVLMRTHKDILPSMTFEQAGVMDDDVIEVRQAGQGAGFDYSALAELLLTSGVTLAALKALTQIIVKLIENQGKKSVTLKLGNDKEITLNGSNSINDLIKVLSVLEQHEFNLQIETDSTEPNKMAKNKQD